jgi:hypothetical protein
LFRGFKASSAACRESHAAIRVVPRERDSQSH